MEKEFGLGNEEKLILYCTLYGDIKLDEYIKKEIDIEHISEQKLMGMLNGDTFKLRSLFFYNLHKYELYAKMPRKIQRFADEEEEKAKRDFDKYVEEIIYVNRKLLERNIRFIILKGIGIAETVYHNVPFLRNFDDIDILVNESDADEIYGYLLNDMGYLCKKSVGERLVYKTFFQHYAPVSRNGIHLEMHHRLTQRGDGYNIDTRKIMQNAKKICLLGTSVMIPNETDMLMHLCYHLFQHEYREARYMIKPYADIFNFLLYYQYSFDWNQFQTTTLENGLQFPVAYSLYYINRLYGQLFGKEMIPKEVLANIIPEDFMEKRNLIVSRHLFNGDEPIGYWGESHMERLFMETKKLRQELCRKYFFFSSEKCWKEECSALGVPFEEGFEFSPRIWEKYGRI